MKKVQSGQGATDLGSLQPDPELQRELATIVDNEQPGITEVVQEIDNLRAAIAEMRAQTAFHFVSRSTIIDILERHGL